MKIIFLDIDGVLNSDEWYHKRFNDGDYEASGKLHHKDDLDPDAIWLLNKLEGASIVISSSWRLAYEQTKSDLEYNGVKLPIVGHTPFWLENSDHRGDEIKEWLKSHPEIKDYVIIDDENDLLPEQQSHFVRTTANRGLKKTDIDKAKTILEL